MDVQTGILRLSGADPEDGFEFIQAPNPGMIPAPQIVPVPSNLIFPLRAYWRTVPHNAYLVVNGAKVETSKERSTFAEWVIHYSKEEGFSFQSAATGKFLSVELLQKVNVNKIANSKATKFMPEWHKNGIFILRCESGKYLGVSTSLSLKPNRLPATSTEEFTFELMNGLILDSSTQGSPLQTPKSPKHARNSGTFLVKKRSSAVGLPPLQGNEHSIRISQNRASFNQSTSAIPSPVSTSSSTVMTSSMPSQPPSLTLSPPPPTSSISTQVGGITKVSVKMSDSPSIFSVGDRGSGTPGVSEPSLRDFALPPQKDYLFKGVFVIKACSPGKSLYVTLMPNGEVLTSPRPTTSWVLESSTATNNNNNSNIPLNSCVIKNYQRDDDIFMECRIPETCSLKCGATGTRFVISSFEFPWATSADSAAGTQKEEPNLFTIQAVVNKPSDSKIRHFLSFVPDDQTLNFVKSVDGTVSKMMLFEFIRIKTPAKLDIRTYPPLVKPYVPPNGLYKNM